MANSKSPLVRVLVPVVLSVLGVVIAWSVLRNTTRSATPRQAAPAGAATAPAAPSVPPATPRVVPVTPEGGEAVDPAAVTPPAGEGAGEGAQTAPAAALTGLRARKAEGGMTGSALGSLDAGQPYKMEVRFNPVGAGIESIRLTEHFQTVDRKVHDEVQATVRYPVGNGVDVEVPPMAALAVELNGAVVSLQSPSVWSETAPGRFEAVIEDGDGTPVARVVRHYKLDPGEYSLRLEQRVVNLSGAPLRVQWFQYGTVSMERGKLGYGGDPRRTRLGYLRSPAADPTQQYVEASRFMVPHATLVGKPDAMGTYAEKVLWPTKATREDTLSLVFVATTNRYFAAAVFPLFDPAAAPPDKRLAAVETIDRFVLPGQDSRGRPDPGAVLRLVSPETTVGANQAVDMSMGVYAGPLARRYTEGSALTRGAGLGELVVYTFGGPCAFCTFQSLAYGLLAFLRVLHSYVVFDWALAIIALVFVVRLVLHPVTKWSQTSMYRFGKQMQALAPKQKKIQEKYKDDPKKLREELARVMREEKINYAGALGCLPMFLQMPVWIALFAMLYFAFDLRHEAAFFGVFQALTGGSWHFLADLAEPDQFVPFGTSFWIPGVSSLMGEITGLNILPLLLGVVFYIQQKYLTPPTTMTMTPEQESQQKMIKVMMVIMFPLFMYNAPSGLALYFITNSTLAIIESRHIRKHAEKVDAERAARLAAGGGVRERRDRGGAGGGRPGFFQRLQEQIEARRKMMEQMQQQRGKNPPGRGSGGKGPRGGGGGGRR